MTKTCQFLDLNGKRCRRKAVKGDFYYHGDDEIYEETKWICTNLCEHHSKPNYIGRRK